MNRVIKRHRGRQGRLRAPYWLISRAANTAIDAAIRADGRRSWDPRMDTPSLSSLQGRARDYHQKYRLSREHLLERAGVRVREYCGPYGKITYIVTLWNEPLSAACRVDRRARKLRPV